MHSHSVKYARLWIFYDPYIHVYRQNRSFCPYIGINGSEKTSGILSAVAMHARVSSCTRTAHNNDQNIKP